MTIMEWLRHLLHGLGQRERDGGSIEVGVLRRAWNPWAAGNLWPKVHDWLLSLKELEGTDTCLARSLGAQLFTFCSHT